MYEKQVHKDGIRRAVMTSMGNQTMRYFDKGSLRKLFTLGPEGACEFLERLKLNGLASPVDSPEAKLTSHSGVVGVSSHDRVYTSNNLVDISNGGTDRPISNPKGQENPFSSASTPPQLGNSSKHGVPSSKNVPVSVSRDQPSETKVLGRSQRALNRRAPAAPLKTANSTASNEKENDTPTTYEEPVNLASSPESSTRNESIECTFQRVDRARASGNHAFAMELLMNFLENGYRDLPREKKMEVHKRTATIAYELQWL
jgi:hypothetical protein